MLGDAEIDALSARLLQRQKSEAQRFASLRADLYNLHGVKPPAGASAWRAGDFLPSARPRLSFADICAIYSVKPPDLVIS